VITEYNVFPGVIPCGVEIKLTFQRTVSIYLPNETAWHLRRLCCS